MSKQKAYDWVDQTLFLMFAYAHFTDWDLADSERALIKSKTQYFLNSLIFGENHLNSLILAGDHGSRWMVPSWNFSIWASGQKSVFKV